MDDRIITIYCLCDDVLKAFQHQEDPQCQMSDAEVLTTGLVAALFFRGNFESARALLREQAYIPHMLSKSRFLRRLQRIRPLLLTLFGVLGETWKELNDESIYVLDTFPIPVCDNYRIPRAKVYHTEEYRGYQASKKRYFYGVKLHLLVTRDGQPVEFFLTPGSHSDTTGLQWFDFDLPTGSTVYGDKAYNVYALEDILRDVGIHLLPMRKENSKRPAPAWLCYLQAHYRKMIETTGSLIERLLPKSIHAVTALGFELKIALFVVACSLNQL
jgi:Transposase DDE domain